MNITSLKLLDKNNRDIGANITLVEQKEDGMNSKVLSIQIKFNTTYVLPANSQESFILTGFVGGITDRYDAIDTGM